MDRGRAVSGRPLNRQSLESLVAQLEKRIESLERRRDVSGIYQIKLFADDEVVTTGDGRFIFEIPYDLDKARLRYVNTYVTTASSSGLVTVQIHNVGTVSDPIALDMLSVPITIDANEKSAEQAATQWVIKDSFDDVGEAGPSYNEYGFPYADYTVFYRQQLRFDIDAAGTGAMGLGVMVGFD